MPFIVYFFVLLLTLYIPLPTLLLLIHRLSYQHDTITMLSKGFLLLFVFLDYKFSFYCIHNCRVKKRYYWYLTLANIFEFFVHLYLLFTYRTVYLSLFLYKKNLEIHYLLKKHNEWFEKVMRVTTFSDHPIFNGS